MTAKDSMKMLREHLPEASALQHVFDHVVPWLCDEGWPTAVLGSVATGEVDVFSDLDLVVLVDQDLARGRQRIFERIRTAGRELVSFAATHIGKPDIHVVYLEVDRWLTKIDVEILPMENAVPLPEEAVVLVDPFGAFIGRTSRQLADLDMEGLEKRFCGWLWYTYCKIARGELFQAARSIDFTREHALLPLMFALEGLPQDGHRRLERRVGNAVLQELRDTYPARLEVDEIQRALLRLADVYLALRPRLRRADLAIGAPDIEPFLRAISNPVVPGTPSPQGSAL